MGASKQERASQIAPVEVVNTFEQLCAAEEVGLPCVAICPNMTPRASASGGHDQTGWYVWLPGKRLPGSEKNAWYEMRGVLIFHDFRCTKAEALEAAKAYCLEHFGIEKWTRNRMHDYVDHRVAKRFPLRKG